MWSFLDKISEQVTKYATFFGQLWYVLVFVFRAIVVMSIGGSVYGDEQGAFQCSTKIVGCENMCYNDFAKISHMRFWAFQLIAVASPTVFFHFYSLHTQGQIQKLKSAEDNLKKIEEGGEDEYLNLDAKAEKDIRKMSRRKKTIGNVKTRKVMSGSQLEEIPYTNKIHYVYFLTIIIRLVFEGLFIYLGHRLFRMMVVDCDSKLYGDASWCDTHNPIDYIWMEVPAVYQCRNSEVCTQHINQDGHGFVPCYVSRPYEKTVFLRYMGVLSGICFIVSILELCVVISRKMWKKHKSGSKASNNFMTMAPLPGKNDIDPRHNSVFYQPAHAPGRFDDRRPLYPSLGVPVRITNGNGYKKHHKGSMESLADSIHEMETKEDV